MTEHQGEEATFVDITAALSNKHDADHFFLQLTADLLHILLAGLNLDERKN